MIRRKTKELRRRTLAFLLENFPAFFTSCSDENPDSISPIRTTLRVSDLSEVACSTTASTHIKSIIYA
jgi:hypothetical protein